MAQIATLKASQRLCKVRTRTKIQMAWIMFDCSPTAFLLSCVAVVMVKSTSRNLVLTITDPRGKKIETLRDQEEMRHHFAAFYSGNYQMCIQNMNNKQDQQYYFSLSTGVQATDYSNIVTKKHLSGVELQA